MKLKVDNVVENNDGSVTVDFEVDDEMELVIAKYYGITHDKLTEELVQDFVIKSINKLVEKNLPQIEQPKS